MPSWVAGGAGTLLLSLISAYVFLSLRCRGAGQPFGPRAKSWAITVIVTVAAISTALGVGAVAASHHIRAAYVGLVVPSSLLLGKASVRRPRRRRRPLLRPLAGYLVLPLHRLDDRMGDDLQDWCDVRSSAVAGKPQGVADAVQYYYNQVAGRLKDDRAREELGRWRESIQHKIKIVQLIDRGAPQPRLEAALDAPAATAGTSRYDVGNPARLAARLQSEAENELHLFLASVYRRGFYKLLIYPARPPRQARGAPRASQRPPVRG